MSVHRVIEGVQEQSSREAVAWQIDVSSHPQLPASVVNVIVHDVTDPALVVDVSETVLTGLASVAEAVLQLPTVSSLSPGHQYEVIVVYQDALNNAIELYIPLECRR